MKAWELQASGRANLHLVETLVPEPGPEQILVRANAVALNFRDKAIVDGIYPVPVQFPLTLGSDLAGEVVSVGPQVTRFKPGDAIVSVFKPLWLDGPPTQEQNFSNLGGPLPGVFAEFVLLSQDGALPYPTYLSPAQASTLPVAAVTAWVALFENGNLQSGDTVLVHGSGGVSLFGLQLGRAAGARVIATSRSSGKLTRLKDLGANEVIDAASNPKWAEQVRKLTRGRGVDQVLEVVGGDSVQQSVEASAWGGHIAIIGFMGGSQTRLSLGSLIFTGVNVRGLAVGSRQHMANMLHFFDHHRIAPVIDQTYSFKNLPDALDHLDHGPFGKVVLEL